MSPSAASALDVAAGLRPASDFGGIHYAVIARSSRVMTLVEKCSRGPTAVKEILRTNDTVLVSAVEALLDGAGIPHLVLDQNMSVLEGSLGILPRRVLVDDDRAFSARRLLEDAGLAGELRPDAG